MPRPHSSLGPTPRRPALSCCGRAWAWPRPVPRRGRPARPAPSRGPRPPPARPATRPRRLHPARPASDMASGGRGGSSAPAVPDLLQRSPPSGFGHSWSVTQPVCRPHLADVTARPPDSECRMYLPITDRARFAAEMVQNRRRGASCGAECLVLPPAASPARAFLSYLPRCRSNHAIW
jgi:hypothetical protein